jgi:peptide/nickel transport system substrate-binding protein
MTQALTESPRRRQSVAAVGALASVTLCLTGACQGRDGRSPQPTAVTFRVGVSVGQMAATNPQAGLGQVAQNQSMEALVNIGDDGRPTAWLAQSWEFTPDGRTLRVHLRPDLKFHDGSAVTATTVAKVLETLLPNFMGPAFADVERITASGPQEIDIALLQRSSFVLEALDLQFRSPPPSSAGTGPFEPVGPAAPTELRANDQYYLGRPFIDRLAVNTYPTARAAWAEMLRDHLDMLYDVVTDALDSLERSNKIQVFTYLRHYQYALIFNTQKPALKSSAVRRALGQAIDRDAILRQALNEHGISSSGPIWPQHWALRTDVDTLRFDPAAAAKELGTRRLHFTCLVPPDYERMALVVKRQLDQINVTMDVQELPPDRIFDAMARRDFDVALFDVLSGPSMFRQFLVWHSAAATNPTGFSSVKVDAALDQIRHSASDDDYRAGVTAFRRAMNEDPPAIFLVWSQRARSVSSRFLVPPPEPGRDILRTLRLWKPVADNGASSRN